MVSFVNICQPGVNLCHGLVSVGQAGVDGSEGEGEWLWGEGYGAAFLFWCERSGSWGKWGCAVAAVAAFGGSWRLTPHLTSPLEGGRD